MRRFDPADLSLGKFEMKTCTRIKAGGFARTGG
jgi:hypothetical protein